MTIGEQIGRLLRMGLLVFVLAAAAFLSALMAMRFAIHGRQVDMPNIVGMSLANAQALLQSRGLQLKIADRIYSNLPENSITRQSPPAGEHMKVFQTVHVIVSLGTENVMVPALSGASLRVARIRLLQSGLQLGEVTSYATPDMLEDTVLQQDPPARTPASTLRVNLLVSQSEPKPAYVMPRLVGMPLLAADRELFSAGLKIAKTTDTSSPKWPPGTIVSQTPDQGSRVAGDIPIELQVAK